MDTGMDLQHFVNNFRIMQQIDRCSCKAEPGRKAGTAGTSCANITKTAMDIKEILQGLKLIWA